MPSVEDVKLHVAVSIQQAEAASLGLRGVLERLDPQRIAAQLEEFAR